MIHLLDVVIERGPLPLISGPQHTRPRVASLYRGHLAVRIFVCIFIAINLAIARADESAPIPLPPNSIFRRIVPGLKLEDVLKVLSTRYPDVKRGGPLMWSGQTGYVSFQLDERCTLSVAAQSKLDEVTVIHPSLKFYLYDNPRKLRLDIERYYVTRKFFWASTEKKKSFSPEVRQ